jgi:hypothetical protein
MFWEALPFVLLAVLIVLLPIGVMGLTASKLSRERRINFLALYGAVILMLVVLVADVRGALGSRLAVDLVLSLGGVGLGVYVAGLFGLRWPYRAGK